MVVQTVAIIAILSYFTLGSPSTVDLSQVGGRISESPNHETGAKVAEWNENLGVNPEELGDYYEGDIILPANKLNGNVVATETLLWPGGRVYYEISPDFDGENLSKIKGAMSHISKQTCIKFVPRSPGQSDFVKFTSDNTGCWTTGIGRLGGEQVINLQAPSCLRRVGSIVHQIMHVLGFGHEHNRPDRDQYVDILWDNVYDGYAENFNKTDNQKTSTLGLPYDPYSIMHYSPKAFTNNAHVNTIEPKYLNIFLDQMGQRQSLTSLDIKKINKLYEKQCSV